MLNEHQIEAMKNITTENNCGCGWYTGDECASYCPHPHNMNDEEIKIHKFKQKERKIIIDSINKIIAEELYPLKNIPEYEQSNHHRRIIKRYMEKIIALIGKRP